MSPVHLSAHLETWSRSIVEAVPTAMIVVDVRRRIVLVNRAAEVLFGWERAELVGQPLETLVPDRFRDAHGPLVDRFFTEPRARPVGLGRDLYARRRLGEEFPVEVGLNPLQIGGQWYTVASVIDLSERRLAEERLRQVVEASPSAMVMVDAQQGIVLVNERAEALFGYQRSELVGQPLDRLVPVAERRVHRDNVDGYARAPVARVMGSGRELRALHRDGTEIPVEIGLNPLRIDGESYVLAAIIDIRERRRAEIDQQRLAAIVEGSADAIFSLSADGRITSWNRGAAQLFGWSADEVVGRSVEFLRSHPPLAFHTEPFDARCVRKDGAPIELSVTLSPLRGPFGTSAGFSAIARDVTELRRRDAELQRSNADLEQYAYVASHDLQEPLRIVANYTELLAERYVGKLDERADRYLHYASDGARRMQRLLTDLLAYSRLGSRHPMEAVSTQRVLDEVVRTLSSRIREAGARIEVGELPVVWGDPTQLALLLQNLLVNALKFRSEAPPLIRVEAVTDASWVRFRVSDNGIGVDPLQTERIFQMFQRLHGMTEYEGSGIGLAIAKRIVERHGGTIGVEPTPGGGATFTFTLPTTGGAS